MIVERFLAALSARFMVSVALVSVALLTIGAEAQAQAPDDPALVLRGQRLFLRCASCHDVSGSGIVKNGPSLKGVVGRKVASVAGYTYSTSLAGLSFVWDEDRLGQWLEKPTAVAPGTTMAFEGMPSAADRKAVIAYLRAQRP
jgi:cytochrome c